MEFTAFDFETANRRSDSACQLAAVVVQGGEVVDQRCWLIRPRPFFFSGMNIRIHGIRPEDVEDEPEFCDLWPEIESFMAGRTLVAHNASFDIKVLNACLQTHRLPLPDLRFTCTRLIARRTWPQWGRYGLKPVSERLGIQFRHHDALEDSRACARVLLAAAEQRRCGSLSDLEQSLQIEAGQCGPLGYRGARSRRSGSSSTRSSRWRTSRSRGAATRVQETAADPAEQTQPLMDVHRLMLRAEMVQSLRGKRVCVTGAFCKLQRPEIEALVRALGGELAAVESCPSDILIRGTLSLAEDVPLPAPPVTWSEEEFLQQLVNV